MKVIFNHMCQIQFNYNFLTYESKPFVFMTKMEPFEAQKCIDIILFSIVRVK
jgi:hypothetical protein